MVGDDTRYNRVGAEGEKRVDSAPQTICSRANIGSQVYIYPKIRYSIEAIDADIRAYGHLSLYMCNVVTSTSHR